MVFNNYLKSQNQDSYLSKIEKILSDSTDKIPADYLIFIQGLDQKEEKAAGKLLTDALLEKYNKEKFSIEFFGRNPEFDRIFIKYFYFNIADRVKNQDLNKVNTIEAFSIDLFKIFEKYQNTLMYYYLNLTKLELGYLNIKEYNDLKKYYTLIIKYAESLDSAALVSNMSSHYYDYANYLYGIERDLEKAEHYFRLSGKDKPLNKKAFIINSLIKIYQDKGDREMALEYSHELLKIEDSLSIMSRIRLYHGLSKIYVEKADFQKSEHYTGLAKKLIYELELKDPDDKYLDLLKFENLSYQLSNARYLEQNLNLNVEEVFLQAEKMGYSQFVYLDAAIGIFAKNGQFKEIKQLEKKLKASNNNFRKMKWEALVYCSFAEAYNRAKNYEKALECIDTAVAYLTLSSNQELFITSIADKNLGLRILKEKFKAQFDLRLSDSSKIQLEDIRITANQVSDLMDVIRINTITKGAKELLLNEAPKLYEKAIIMAYKLYLKSNDRHYLEEAFGYAEKSKAILLLDALKETEARKFAGIPDTLLKKEQSLNNDINYYSAEKLKAEAADDSIKIALYNNYLYEKRVELQHIKSLLEQNYPKYFDLKYSTNICEIKTFQKRLKEHQTEAIEYVLGDSSLYIFKISPDSIEFLIQQLPNTFHSDFAEYYKVLTDVNFFRNKSGEAFQQLNSLGENLYNLLLQPVFNEDIPSRVLIIPDGKLSYIPFEALVRSSERSKNFAKADYLLNYCAVSYAYSATLWLENIKKEGYRGSNSKILAMSSEYADKVITQKDEWSLIRNKLKPIEAAKEEVLGLQQKFSGNFICGPSATETEFKLNASNYSVLHLAMHGIVDENNNAYSGIFFSSSEDSTNDDILFAYEIPSLNIAAEMVVLSACQTGYGKYQNGEGVISLGRSFMYAGAKSVIMTLWEVNDQSGKKLMELFYTYLDKGFSKDKALRMAKIDYIAKAEGLYAHPYFWSNFVLIGDPAPISIKKALRQSTVNIYLIGLIVTVLLAAILFWLGRKKAEPVDSAEI